MTRRPAGGAPVPPEVYYRARVLVAETPEEIAREIRRTDSDPEGVGIMTRKGRTLLVRLDRVSLKASPLLKQEMLAVGADAAHARGIAALTVKETPAVLIATPAQYQRVIPKLRRQPFHLRDIATAIQVSLSNFTTRAPRTLRGLHRSLKLGDRTHVMGVLNVTPDSFSDGGLFLDPGAAEHHAIELEAAGADIIDIGAESTRPGATSVSARAEAKRLLPALDRVHDATHSLLSIDTRKPEVARMALDHGADLINDVGGLRSAGMRRVVARTGAPVVVMHMRGTPEDMQQRLDYADLMSEVYGWLADQTAAARRDGVSAEQMLIDPGLGFGKSGAQNLVLLNRLAEFRSLGCPIVVGASRKSFLGTALGGADSSQREEASLAAGVIAALHGADVVRSHEVRGLVRALALTDAVRRQRFGPRVVPPPQPTSQESG